MSKKRNLLQRIFWAIEEYLDSDYERTKTLLWLISSVLILTYLVKIAKAFF